jgi:outer membrane protein TolC
VPGLVAGLSIAGCATLSTPRGQKVETRATVEALVDGDVRAASAEAPKEEASEARCDAVPTEGHFPIDLASALRLAVVANPRIAEAQAVVLEALANQTGAMAMLLPSFNAGVTYHGHGGVLQRSSGRILRLWEQSLYVGGGARTLAAESVGVPAVNITSPLTDAIFEPLAARQNVTRRQFEAVATSNDVLRDVVVAHIDLVAAHAALQAMIQSEDETLAVARITSDYAEAGEGRLADADRANAEARLSRVEILRLQEEVAVASSRLAQLLNLDPSMRLEPVTAALVPIILVPLDATAENLLREALQRRPEMAARAARVAEAETQLVQEKARPFLPTLWMGFSGGVFGGGSNLVPPLIGNFGGRSDFDVRLFWTISNLGAGNYSLAARRRAEVGVAMGEQSRTIAEVRREVAEARAEAEAAWLRIESARRQVQSAEEGYHRDLERSREDLGRPIEVLNSVNLLATARQDLVRAIADFNRQQYRLFVALGSPPPE